MPGVVEAVECVVDPPLITPHQTQSVSKVIRFREQAAYKHLLCHLALISIHLVGGKGWSARCNVSAHSRKPFSHFSLGLFFFFNVVSVTADRQAEPLLFLCKIIRKDVYLRATWVLSGISCFLQQSKNMHER